MSGLSGPSAKILERAQQDPLVRNAIEILMNSSTSYVKVLEGLTLALSDERKMLLDAAVKYAERQLPNFIGFPVKFIPDFPDDCIYLKNDPTSQPKPSPWDEPGRDIMKDIADAMKVARENSGSFQYTLPRPAKSMVLGDCKVCGAPFSLPVRKGVGGFPDIIGSIRIEASKEAAEKPYDFRDGVHPDCLCHETVVGKTCPVHPPQYPRDPTDTLPGEGC